MDIQLKNIAPHPLIGAFSDTGEGLPEAPKKPVTFAVSFIRW